MNLKLFPNAFTYKNDVEVHLNVYGHTMQYKKEVELMIEVARSYIKSRTSGGETDNVASDPSNTAITEKSNA